jgi:hypothetical protein
MRRSKWVQHTPIPASRRWQQKGRGPVPGPRPTRRLLEVAIMFGCGAYLVSELSGYVGEFLVGWRTPGTLEKPPLRCIPSSVWP